MSWMSRLFSPKPPRNFDKSPPIKELMRSSGYGYYFFLTFSTQEQAATFWRHMTALRRPPAPSLFLWGSWLSIDYQNAQRWFVAWLSRNQQESNAIARWESAARRPDTPAGAGYGSPGSPLGVGINVKEVFDTQSVS
jgi:hypothetical protein